MTPDERKMLEEAVRLSRENNEILKKMRRSAVMSTLLRVLYIAIILAITAGSYYLALPYINQIRGLYDQVEGTVGKVNGGFSEFTNIINDLKQ